MNPWRPFPLIRLIIPVMIGTVAALFTRNQVHIPFSLFMLLFFFLAALVFFKSVFQSYRVRWLPGVMIILLISLLSFETALRKNDFHSPDYFMKPGSQFFLAEIVEPVSLKTKSVKAIVEVIAVNCQGRWCGSRGKALVYIQRDFQSEKLFFGDRIIMNCNFREPSSASFPGSFDQKSYLERRNIYHISFLGSGNWKLLPWNDVSLLRYALKMRNRLLWVLHENHVEGREFAVSAALLLGYVEEIDRELLRDYSATGAMHILSVSGMHVGIIFLVLDKILAFLVRMKYGAIFKTILVILIIWFYAMLTGLSPAVMRASVMITLVVIAKAMKRQPDILNILAASFIFLVIHEPTLLLDVGFQLSYLAVAGILALYKPVYDLYITSSYIPDKIWSIIAVSIVAQIATFPLSLHYFHQFPNYFMITNIIVVPLSSVVIYTGVLLLFFGSVTGISLWLAKLLSTLVWGLNIFIHFIGKIPFALSKGIYISAVQTLLLYLLIVFIILFLFMKRKVLFFLLLALLTILTSTLLLRKVESMTTGKIIVYGIKDLSAIELVRGDHAVFLYSPEAAGNVSFLENRKSTLDALWIEKDIRLMMKNTDEAESDFAFRDWFFKKGEFIQFGDIRLAIHCKGFTKPVKHAISLDYLILTGNPDISIGQLLKSFKVREIIADPTNRGWRVKRWKEEAKQCGIRFYPVSETGAFYRKF